MSRLRVLIADDEPLARTGLRAMLAEYPDVEVVGECADGDAAVRSIRAARPDLVLLDVEMPGRDGFQVLDAIPQGERPHVVFVTAYDEFAVRAFEVRAADYLLKPVREDRLVAALARCTARRDPEWVVVRRGKARVPVQWADVEWIEAAGNYARLHGREESFLLRSTLSELETKLRSVPFARIHRRALVNVNEIGRIVPMGHGDFLVVLRSGHELVMSRRYRRCLEETLGSLA